MAAAVACALLTSNKLKATLAVARAVRAPVQAYSRDVCIAVGWSRVQMVPLLAAGKEILQGGAKQRPRWGVPFRA